MPHKVRNLTFSSSDGEAITEAFSYSIDQYLIIERDSKMVRAILFLVDTFGEYHNYDSLSMCISIHSGTTSPIIPNIESDLLLEIESKINDEGISLMSCQVVHSNSMFIPFISETFGSMPELFPNWEYWDDEVKWSLHII